MKLILELCFLVILLLAPIVIMWFEYHPRHTRLCERVPLAEDPEVFELRCTYPNGARSSWLLQPIGEIPLSD